MAYSYAAINKKVLLIDGNFNNPTLTNIFQPKVYVEDYFRNSAYLEKDSNSISILGNHGGDITLLEINDEKHVSKELNDLKGRYDIIIIDLPPVNSLNKSKEWLLFANKAVAVFEANKGISRPEKQYVDYLQSLHDKFGGWVLNKATINSHSKS